MAHFTDEDPVGEKVKLRFPVAEAVIVDKLVVKQGEKQPLKGSKECVSLAEELSNTLKAKSGRGFLEESNKGVGSKKGSGNANGAKGNEKKVLNKKGLDLEAKSVQKIGKTPAGMSKGKRVNKVKSVSRAAHKEVAMETGKEVKLKEKEVKLEPFLPNFEDDGILAGRVKGSLDIEGNLESTSCKATSMNDQRREIKHVNTKEKTHETNQGQESKKSNNEGRKKRYKTLALAVKRHQETSEERMKKQDHLFACVSKNLDQIDLLLGRMV